MSSFMVGPGLSHAVVAMALTDSVIGQSFAGQLELAPVTMMDAGSLHTVLIVGDTAVNVVKDWGANGDGQLGLDDDDDRGGDEVDAGDSLPSINLDEGLQAVDVTAGFPNRAASLDDGTVSGRGYNGKRQLDVEHIQRVGDGPNEVGNMPVTRRGGLTPASISAGEWHTCAITDDKRLKCWGYNQWGELGLGLQEYRGGEPGEMRDNLPFVDLGDDIRVEHIALGDWHTCVLSTEGDVKCFGKNHAGQLGYDDTNNRGDESDEMGNQLDKVYLGGKKATMVACGQEHTCAILEDGKLRCWGLGASGQLGQGNRNNIGDTPGDMDKLVGIDLGTGRTAMEVVAGGNHTCALLDNDDVKCWGENDFGELGQGDTVYRGVAPNEMGDNLAPIEFKATSRVQSLSAGQYHTCAVLDETDALGVVTESVRCWGANFEEQIGLSILEETEKILDVPHGMGDTLQSATVGVDQVDEHGQKWYETIFFIVAAAVAGGMICCCLLCICVRIQSEKSRRRIARPTPPLPQGVSEIPPDVETAVGRMNAAICQGATGHPLRGYSVKRAARKREGGTATVVGSPADDVVAASAPPAPAGEGFAPAMTVTAPAAV